MKDRKLVGLKCSFAWVMHLIVFILNYVKYSLFKTKAIKKHQIIPVTMHFTTILYLFVFGGKIFTHKNTGWDIVGYYFAQGNIFASSGTVYLNNNEV